MLCVIISKLHKLWKWSVNYFSNDDVRKLKKILFGEKRVESFENWEGKKRKSGLIAHSIRRTPSFSLKLWEYESEMFY